LLACLFFKVFFGRLFLYLPYQQKRICVESITVQDSATVN
jgi:hypothetical protein